MGGRRRLGPVAGRGQCVRNRDSTFVEQGAQMPWETSLPARRIVSPHHAQTTVICPPPGKAAYTRILYGYRLAANWGRP
jgi:hypothetical protein